MRQLLQIVGLTLLTSFFAPQVLAQDKNDVSDPAACAVLRVATGPMSAEFVVPPFTTSARGTTGPEITVHVPFCRVVGTIKPTPDSDIRFEVWLPPRTDWNGKFAGVGSGGSRGSIEHQRLMGMLVRGYAAMSTDSGHRSVSASDVTWALGHPDRVVDFGYRAEHLATVAAKALTARFYGRESKYSYFVGCSQGGHHGLMEAQRFPQDYDGIVAGAPVYDWIGEMTEQGWNARALEQTPTGALSNDKLQSLHQAVLRACAAGDGLIEDPRRCSFDPVSLRCRDSDRNSCLSDKEIAAVRKMYTGPKTSAGVRIYPGLSRGGEAGWSRLWSNARRLGGSWLGFYRYMVFQNPTWDLSMLDFDRDPAYAEQKIGQAVNANNPDLSGFVKRGGKLIIYHGWADDMVPSQTSVEYYEAVRAKLGAPQVAKFYRLFMIPGMWHCSSGPDVLFHSEEAPAVPLASGRDMLRTLEEWVEHGRAPEKFETSLLTKDGKVARTHLVCAYPKVAKYRGAGDIRYARNWECSADARP